MRFYLIILSDIIGDQDDLKFSEYVQNSKFEYWRYTALNWILATPNNVSTNMILAQVIQAYGHGFNVVLEISINDVAGVFPGSKELPAVNPFAWFNLIRENGYVPKWEQKEKV